jgi:hypothetical protein
MHRIALCLVVAASVAGAAESPDWRLAPSLSRTVQESHQDSPFAGTWVENLVKSNRNPNEQLQSATLELAVVGNKITITRSGVNTRGQKYSRTLVLEADGQEHPVPEQTGIVVVTTWSGPRLLHAVTKEVGATVGESEYKVSTDGQTLTATASGTDESGTPYYQVTVFDRQHE